MNRLDVWQILVLISETALRLWGRLAALPEPWPTALALAGLIGVGGVFLLLLLPRRGKGTGLLPRRAVTLEQSLAPDHRAPDPGALPFAASGEKVLPMPVPSVSLAGVSARSEMRGAGVQDRRREIIARLEAARGSRVIAIIHRDTMERSVLDVVDLEDVLTAIRQTPKDKPLDIIIHSRGGLIRAAQQIARAMKDHPARTTVFVPYYALRCTTLIAFAADEIVMSPHAALSPIDPYVGLGSASALLAGIRGKPVSLVDDETLVLADVGQKLLREARSVTCELMDDGTDHDGVCRLSDELVSGRWSVDRAITPADAAALGLRVSTGMPDDVLNLVRACRHGAGWQPSVATLDLAQDGARARLRADAAPRASGIAGLYDDPRALPVPRERAAGFTTAGTRPGSVWLAQAGSHVPEKMADRARGIIRQIEQQRGSRVICIIHGENMEREAFSFEDLEDMLAVLMASDTSRPLDIVLHTLGGVSFAGRQIARALKAHPARKTVFVPYFAMSAGTRVSLAADEIVMGPHATLGPIDTQLHGLPSPSLLRLPELKPSEAISDQFLVFVEEARKLMAEGRSTAHDLLRGTYPDETARSIADELMSGRWTHGFGISATTARSLGLNVSTDMPDAFHDLIRCFRHADGEDPSVLFA